MLRQPLRSLVALFPPPRFLSMPAGGIDISDSAIKYCELISTKAGYVPKVLTTIALPDGVVVEGAIQDSEALTRVLEELRKQAHTPFVNVALPEEYVYLYTLEVPVEHTRRDIVQVIEFSLAEHVPIAVENAVFDYDTVRINGNVREISVSVFSRDIVDGYYQACANAGFAVKALELEAHAVARSIVPARSDSVAMIIDIGRNRTGITIAYSQTPLFTTTIRIGGDAFSDSIRKHTDINITDEDIDRIKWEEGISQCTNEALCAELQAISEALAKDLVRHFRYWNTHRDHDGVASAPITDVYLCGGAVALRGFPEYVSDALRMPVKTGNVWRNAFSFDDYIPSIPQRLSWGYATAIGLVLRDILN